MASQDSSCASVSLATVEFYNAVLNSYSDAELRSVMDVATGAASWRPSSCISNYKEIQIHGEVNLSEHVEA